MTGKTILPLKLESARDSITSHAGLALFRGFALGRKLKRGLAVIFRDRAARRSSRSG